MTTTRTTIAPSLGQTLKPLAIDIVVPTATYYLLYKGCGVPLITALAASSILPMIRTAIGVVRDRRLNALAALMLAVNLAGIALSFLVGDARLMIAKDSGISSIIAATILVSVLRGRPMMSAGLEPFLTKGDPAKITAWQQLTSTAGPFRRLEARYSLIWGAALLTECVARIVGAFTLPISTMMWLSSVLIWSSIAIGIVVGGAVTVPMEQLLAEVAHRTDPADPAPREN